MIPWKPVFSLNSETFQMTAVFVCKQTQIMVLRKCVDDCQICELLSIDCFSDLSNCDCDREDGVCNDISQKGSDDLLFSDLVSQSYFN